MRLLQAFLLPAFNIPAALAANSTDVFYFMHISKAGGASFTDDLGARKHVGASAGYVSCGALHGARVDGRIVHDCRKYLLERPAIGCNFYACEGNHFNNLRLVSGSFAPAANVRTLLLVREPERTVSRTVLLARICTTGPTLSSARGCSCGQRAARTTRPSIAAIASTTRRRAG